MKTKSSTTALVMCGLFAALTAIGAFIKIPVPGMDYFTLQFFFVLMAGMLLGSRLGAAAVASYVLLGLFGLPIFAAGGGFTYVLRPSFGYLPGFIVTAYAAGMVVEKTALKGIKKYLLAALTGFIVCYAIGLTYKYLMLNVYVGEKTSAWMVLLDCFPLDMPGDVVLSVLASGCAVKLRPALQTMAHDSNISG